MNHSTTVLGKDNSNADNNAFFSAIAASLGQHGVPGISGSAPEGGEKKRKKRAADPNAPKRTLTPFFLYMHHNRPIIAEELGSDAKPKEVQSEGTKRWAEMPDSQKEVCF